MFKEMRRNERKLKLAEAIEILKNCDYGILSTVGDNGYPYGVPVNYIYFDTSIYLHCAASGCKLDNIKNNDKVSFSVVCNASILPDRFSTMYDSVIIFGKAKEVSDSEKNKYLLELIKKYSPDYIQKGSEYIKNSSSRVKVIEINIEHISGKANK
ncbi:pyridoxamine 5'-phosphate oxidase family protein [Clostridium polynesiense]|uniref:pyridoxamine 5'-phosphate oxidase family protein n=1 Tax=Clostridium polynesiense TaxID=1325933 RepID=UPI00058B6DB4|nr:pyridoxamine 5'-phosphate oxidase family protein [Clostridium polynesiense]